MRRQRRARRDGRGAAGAAAVEGALVTSAILGPLLVGVLTLGHILWTQQQVTLYPPRLDPGLVVGSCTTAQIVDRVTASAAEALYTANQTTLDSLGIRTVSALADRLAVTVSSVGSVGADVTVRLSLPSGGLVGGLVNSSQLLFDTTQRLSYVAVTTGGTSCSSTP